MYQQVKIWWGIIDLYETVLQEQFAAYPEFFSADKQGRGSWSFPKNIIRHQAPYREVEKVGLYNLPVGRG